jgi:hypothetical protein
MQQATIDERLTRVEQLLDVLMRRISAEQRRSDWRRTIGMFDDDPIMKEIIDEGRRIREQDRIDSES